MSIAAITVTNSNGKTLMKISPNAFPCTKMSARKEMGEEGMIEFVQVRVDLGPCWTSSDVVKLAADYRERGGR